MDIIDALEALLTIEDFTEEDVYFEYKGEKYYLDTCKGICEYLTNLGFLSDGSEESETLAYNFRKWPKFSGSQKFPVPSRDEDCPPSRAFFRVYNVWLGGYGEDRLDLVRFLLEQLEEGTYYD